MQTSITSNLLKISFRFVLSFIFSRCIILTLATLRFPLSVSLMCHRYLFPLTYFCCKHIPSCSTYIFLQRIIIKISEKAESHNFIKPLIIFVFNVYNFPYKIQEWQELHWTNWRIEWNNRRNTSKTNSLKVWIGCEINRKYLQVRLIRLIL